MPEKLGVRILRFKLRQLEELGTSMMNLRHRLFTRRPTLNKKRKLVVGARTAIKQIVKLPQNCRTPA